MTPGIIGAVIAALLLGLLLVLWQRQRRPQQARQACQRLLQAQGAARCQAALPAILALSRLTAEEQQDCWESIELPLVEALPDCPPDLKTPLINALDSLHQHCRHRQYQRRIMVLRNSLA